MGAIRTKRVSKLRDGKINMAFRGDLFPDHDQEILIKKTCGCSRYVFNHFLEQRINEYKDTKKSLSYVDQANKLPEMKKCEETIWLSEVDSTALQNSVRDLQDAFDNFFRGIREGQKIGFPKFKSKHGSKRAYRTTNNNDSIRMIGDNHIMIPKLGKVKVIMPRGISGRILHATISITSEDRYEISIQCETDAPEECAKTGSCVGVDLGLKNLAVTSDGVKYDNPRSYKNNLKRLRRLQRRLSRKTKDSKKYMKNKSKLAKLHRHIANQRKDAAHKMTHDLVMNHDVICIEDLKPSNMIKNRRLAQAISDASFGEIRRQLAYKCEWYNRKLVVVDKWFPSSQTCSGCGYRNPDVKDLNVRYWRCPVCGEEHDRDINAAVNILNEGLKHLA